MSMKKKQGVWDSGSRKGQVNEWQGRRDSKLHVLLVNSLDKHRHGYVYTKLCICKLVRRGESHCVESDVTSVQYMGLTVMSFKISLSFAVIAASSVKFQSYNMYTVSMGPIPMILSP